MKLTKKSVEALVPEQKTQFYMDSKTRGFQVCVTPAGMKTYYLVRRLNGVPTRLLIGRHDEISAEVARGIAEEWNPLVSSGVDPRVDRSENLTFAGAFEIFMERHAKVRKKTWHQDELNFRRYLRPIANRPLKELTPGELQALHVSIGKKNGQRTANLVHSLIREVFNKAIRWELFDLRNPATTVERFPEVSRERFLSREEMPRFLMSLKADFPHWHDFFLLCLFTGARRSNVLAMAWENVSLREGTWLIPVTKTGHPYLIPLVREAVALLEHRRVDAGDSPWVFPSQRGGHLTHPQKAWERIVERADIQDLHIHDLRRTLGSWQASMGSGLPVIGRSLGHRSPASTNIYSRLQLDPVRDSMDAAVTSMLEES